jgi:hypothetical protein
MNAKIALTILLAAALTGCSEPSSVSAAGPQEIKPTQAETGRVALQRLYTTSRGWASDTDPVSIQSSNYKNAGGNPNAPLGQDGKSAIWRAVFASQVRRSMKTYMWSGLTGPNAPAPGLTPGNEDSWNVGNTSTRPFQLMYLKYDSDQALQIAGKHGGAALLKKDPNLPVNYVLSWEPRRSMLVWHVMYGKSTNEPDLDVVVNATTNDFVRVEK